MFDLDISKDMRDEIQSDPNQRNELYHNFLRRVRKNFKLIFNFTPSRYDFREKMEFHKNLMINSQMIWIQNLQEEDLEEIGKKVFIESELERIAKMPRDPNMADQEYEYLKQRETRLNEKALKAVIYMYLKSLKVAKQYMEETQHKLYFTPVAYIRTFKTFTRLLDERRKNVVDIQKRYDKGMAKIKETMDAVKYQADKLKKKTPVL